MGTKLKVDTYDLGSVTTASSGAGSEVHVLDRYNFLTFIAFNPVGGGGTGVAEVQISPDNGGTWVTADTTVGLGSGGFDKKEFDPPAPLVRIRVTASAGTPTIHGRILGARDKDIKAPHQRVATGQVSLAAGSQNMDLSLDRAVSSVRLYAIWVGGSGNIQFQGSFDSVNFFNISSSLGLNSGVPAQQAALKDHFIRHYRVTFTRTAGTFQAYAVGLGLNEEE